jgi:hypothetical protein
MHYLEVEAKWFERVPTPRGYPHDGRRAPNSYLPVGVKPFRS